MMKLKTENNVALEINNVGDLPYTLHVYGTVIRLTDEMAADIKHMIETAEQIRNAADQFNRVNNPPMDVPF
jgi:hypothetical protein